MKNTYISSSKKWLVAVFVTAIFMLVGIGSTNAQQINEAVGTSEIQKAPQAVSLTAISDGVNIKVNAADGILPEGTQLSVKLLTDKEEEIYIKSLKENNGIRMSQSLFYDITLHDKQGREIQPKGEVTVSFSGLNFENNGTGLVVLHAEENVNGKEGFLFSKKYPEINTRDHKSLAQYASINPNEIQFKTAHFSVYAVGTTQTATYNFTVNSAVQQTQIVLNGESLIEPETPTAPAGQRFAGWYVQGETSPVVFNQAVTVSSTSTLTVNAQFESVWYVFFNYDGVLVATKDVAPGTTTDASGVPLVVKVLGKVFSHWSTTVNGPAFDFNTPINANITLYAVLADSWIVSFNSQGGSPVMPAYVTNGATATPPANPTRVGYTFAHWSTSIGGAAFNFSTPITASTILYAVWTAQTVNYSVVYWQQNAEDNDYTYYETKTRTGLTGANATYATESYTGFALNSTLTNAPANNPVIKGDGTTVKNVYYDRKVYTFTIEWKSKSGNTWTTFSTTQVKYGQSTAPWYNAAVAAHFGYRWLIARGSSTSYSEAPDMPNNHLTVSGEYAGDTPWTIHYMEKNTTTSIHPDYIFYASGSVSYNFTIEDGIAIAGFTVTNLNQWEPLHTGTPAREGTIYYTRNNYTITFNTNDGQTPTVSGLIPYQASIANQALAGYIEGVTTKTVDDITYTFDGWYESPTFSTTKYSFAGKTMPAKNLVLYAKWIPPTYTVLNHKVLENPGPSGNTIAIPVPLGGTISAGGLLYDIPSGLTVSDFVGWYWYVGNLFVPYDFGMAIYFDLELFPVWNEQTYSVTYALNGAGGTVPTDANIYHLGAAASVAALPGDIVPPTGKFFIGWKDQNLITHYPNNGLNIIGNMTLTAQWGDPIQKTQLIYKPNGGTGSDIVLPGLDNNITLQVEPGNTYTNTGYSFGGWNTAADGSGAAFAPGANIIVNNSSPVPNILYAQWINISLTKTGVFNDLNSNGKADVGETITYTFTVTNGGFIPLTNITITDLKITVNGGPITLAAGATSTSDFTGTYTLVQADLDAGKVDNTATVTGYTPILEIPVSDDDSETVEFEVCTLDVTCPVDFAVTVECNSQVPTAATTQTELESLGIIFNDNCGTLVISHNDASDGNTCPEIITRTYTILDDLNGNGTKDTNEEEVSCIQTITVDDNTAPTGTAPFGTNDIEACYVDATTPPTGTPAFDATTASAGYIDNCGGTVTATLTNTAVTGDNCNWTVTYTFKVADACGNELENQTIQHTGGDKTAPTGTAPAGASDIDACYVDATTPPTGTPALDAAVAAAGYTDNCGGTVTATLTNTAVTGDNCAWTVTYTFKVSDACGNELENQTIQHTGGD
ncbi:MAG: InlB B-repeat-containing protein, partial [Lentimicrobiaceae bacterium]|nr:InlB B-repeat-containing protein [Lentimicrobiaceae bacterium]